MCLDGTPCGSCFDYTGSSCADNKRAFCYTLGAGVVDSVNNSTPEISKKNNKLF